MPKVQTGACWAGCPKGQRWSVQGPKQVQAPASGWLAKRTGLDQVQGPKQVQAPWELAGS